MARILIIDDDEQIRTMLQQMFEREGYEAAAAADGRIGIRLYKENPADVVITDIIMPEKEGIETIRELKRDYPDVRIIAMSGGGRIGPENYLKIARGLGAEKTLTKPVERKTLLAAVRDVLENPKSK